MPLISAEDLATQLGDASCLEVMAWRIVGNERWVAFQVDEVRQGDCHYRLDLHVTFGYF